jgi:hypothetical protein
MSDSSIIEFISEVGNDMKKWKSYKHFCAWLNLTPNTKVSGGKVLSSNRMKKKNTAGQILKQAASTLYRSDTSLGAYYRIIRSKIGGKGAVTATAHKLARIIYTMILNQTEYNSEIMTKNDVKSKEQKIKKLERQLEKLKAA